MSKNESKIVSFIIRMPEKDLKRLRSIAKDLGFKSWQDYVTKAINTFGDGLLYPDGATDYFKSLKRVYK